MKARGIRLAGAVIACFVIATAVAQWTMRLADHSPGTPAQPASAVQGPSTLPSGVCPFRTDDVPVAEATKMQAELVLFDVALASDPYFPFKGSVGSTAARQEPVRVANYFWITAAAGNFPNDFPRPPDAHATDSFRYFVSYQAADRCNIDGGYAFEGLGAWPAWFDHLSSLSHITIK